MLGRNMNVAVLLLMLLGSPPIRAIDDSASTALVGYVPANGFLPDAKTATAVAYAILIPIYGEEAIRQQLPLDAKLDGNVWIVKGTLRSRDLLGRVRVGGVATIKLSKPDGRVLFVLHDK